MSVASELKQVSDNLTTAATGVSAQAAQIAALQAQIANSSSTLTADDQAALDSLVTSSAALDAQLNPPAPAAPAAPTT